MLDVFMYGRSKNPVPNTCSCGISETPGRDAYESELFYELKDFLESTDIGDKINLKFIDVEETKQDTDQEISKLLEKYGTPIISICEKEFLIGKFHNANVYVKTKEFLQKQE